MLPKMGNQFPNRPINRSVSIRYAAAISEALNRELGGSHRSIKTVMSWTNASERTVKNWLSGERGPNGEHLVAIIRHSDAALDALLAMANRRHVSVALKIHAVRESLTDLLSKIDELTEKGLGS